jgi:hypothetical protein
MKPLYIPRYAFLVAVLLFLSIFIPVYSRSPSAPQPKIALKLLYATNFPNNMSTPRTKEYVEFLKTYFTNVDAIDIAKLKPNDAAPYDVLLIDAEPGEKSVLDVPQLDLPQDFSKPTLTLGVMGGLFTSNRGLKTGYL